MEQRTTSLAQGENYLFVGSEAGGKAAAIAYTLIETAKLERVDPSAWPADTIGLDVGLLTTLIIFDIWLH